LVEIDAGRLAEVLGDWCPIIRRYRLVYPSRPPSSATFNVVVDALRERG
jgi:DNA-binding transcriptional LysR family regulator